MSKTKAWISAMRLRTLPLSFSVIIVGNALVYNNQEICCMFCGPDYVFNWMIFGLTLLTTLLLQILSNFANDYGDAKKGADNENRVGPERAVQSGILSAREMFKGIIILVILSFISGIALLFYAFGDTLNWVFFAFILLGILSIAAAIKYTVGKKAYGYSGLGDLFVFIFFGLVGVIGSAYLHVHEFRMSFLIHGIIMGSLSVAVLNLNNMRDQINDKAVGKNTIVVKLGFEKGKIYHYLLFITVYLCLFLPLLPHFMYYWKSSLLFLPVFIIHLIHLKKVFSIKNPTDFDPELKKIALSTFLLSLIIFAQAYFQF